MLGIDISNEKLLGYGMSSMPPSLLAYLAENELNDVTFSRLVGVSDELVRLWRHGRRGISTQKAKEISKLTGVPLHELRPDVWDPPTHKAA